MPVRKYRPTSPGRRKSSVNTYVELTKNAKPHKALLVRKLSKAGRNFSGKITVRHQGGGNKNHYRLVDFKQFRFGIPAVIKQIEYDPNRSAFIALIEYQDGEKSYILAAEGMKVGESVLTSKERLEIHVGNRTTLGNIPTGIAVHNIEINAEKGGVMVRSAGNSAMLMSVEGDYALLKFPSGEIRKILKNCFASIGQVSNIDHGNIRWGKAGRMRWMGIRPSVRGKAMNPVDHPHGGGEGNQPIGMKYPKTPWGKHALGVKTRKRKKYSNRMIVSRRPKR